MSETRKIAAILVSDIVGYSRLTGADEDRILGRLRALRSDLIDPTIALHHGRVVKRTGDGALVEFRSVVDAVRCAIEVQNGMIERNAGLPPERRIEFRIGIHLGDVVEESDGDLMGDGVNIAARLEGIAQAGAICLSEDAYRQVSARLDMTVADLGPTQLKNIERPIRVYSLQVGTPTQPKPTVAVAKPAPKRRALLAAALLGIAALVAVALAGAAWRWRGGERPALTGAAAAVAVLPFDNLGGDAEAGRLADGMTEDIITDLGHFKEFLVIGRNSIMQYKGKPVEVRQVARDLNVNYLLTGSIQHRADRLRVTAQLLDASTGAEIWSQRWDRPGEDLFAVQAEVAENVAKALAGNNGSNLGPIKGRLLAEAHKRPPANLSAYDLLLLGREQFLVHTKETRAKAWEYVEKAISLDPNLSAAYSLRGWLTMKKDTPWETRGKEFEADMRHALALDPANPSAQAGLMLYFGMSAQWNQLSAQIERAMRDNPTNISVLSLAASQSIFLGKPDDAVAFAELSLRLDPNMPPAQLSGLVLAFTLARKFGRAVEVGEQIPDGAKFVWEWFYLATSYAFLGRDAEAKRAKEALVATFGEQVMEIWANEGDYYARTNEQDVTREGFRKLGMRICATPDELKKYPNPKRLPECVKS